MTLRRAALGVAAVLAPAAALAEPVDYQTTPTHTFVHLEVMQGGLSTRRLRLNRAEGRVSLDREAARGRIAFSVQTASVSTGDAALDATLRTWLQAEAHPTARFESEALRFDGPRLRGASGTLTLRGTAGALDMVAEHFNCYLSPLFRREVCGGEFTAEVDLGRWGPVPPPQLGWAPSITLRVQVEAIRQ